MNNEVQRELLEDSFIWSCSTDSSSSSSPSFMSVFSVSAQGCRSGPGKINDMSLFKMRYVSWGQVDCVVVGCDNVLYLLHLPVESQVYHQRAVESLPLSRANDNSISSFTD